MLPRPQASRFNRSQESQNHPVPCRIGWFFYAMKLDRCRNGSVRLKRWGRDCKPKPRLEACLRLLISSTDAPSNVMTYLVLITLPWKILFLSAYSTIPTKPLHSIVVLSPQCLKNVSLKQFYSDSCDISLGNIRTKQDHQRFNTRPWDMCLNRICKNR